MKEPVIRTHNREIDELFERYRRAPGSHVFAPLADAYRKLGLLEEALDICARGLSANPRYASGCVVQGKCQYDAGRADRAEESFRRVLEIDPHNLVALRYLGIIRAACGDPDGARGFFEHILTLDPGDKDIQHRLEAIRENRQVPPSTLVDEIENVLLQPARGSAPSVAPAAPATDDIEVGGSDAVMELPEVREDFEGSPILLGDESVTTDYIATVTLADIFAAQGYAAKAIRIYQDVLRRQPDNVDVKRKMAALEAGAPIALGDDSSPRSIEPLATRSPDPASPAPATPPVAPAAPLPTQGAGPPAAIDEGRSYEQFKRWLRTVSD